jgi:hypothetical protein
MADITHEVKANQFALEQGDFNGKINTKELTFAKHGAGKEITMTLTITFTADIVDVGPITDTTKSYGVFDMKKDPKATGFPKLTLLPNADNTMQIRVDPSSLMTSGIKGEHGETLVGQKKKEGSYEPEVKG